MDVKTAARTLAIFESFATALKPLTLAELSRMINAPSSSCLYILRTLESAGYIYPAGPRKSFYPTRKMLDLVTLIAESEPWLEEIVPSLEELRLRTQETVILGKLQGPRIVYLVVLDGPQTIRYSANAGDSRAVHSTSIGKAIVSALPPAQQARVIRSLKFEQITDTTITDRAAFEDELRETVKRGYSVTRGESAAGVMAIAKPFSRLEEVYGIAIAGPMERMNAHFEAHVAQLNKACRDIGELKGGPGPD